jgi:hypothetical protein
MREKHPDTCTRLLFAWLAREWPIYPRFSAIKGYIQASIE